MNGMTAKKRHGLRRHAKVYVAVSVMACPMFSTPVGACTIGVADGYVTMDGRPLAWKVRDTGNTRQQLVYTSAFPYSYIGVRSEGGQCTTGLNTAGLSIGDSLVGTSAKSPTQLYILANFDRVEQIRNFYQGQEDADELAEASCFPHIDAAGNAALFEVGSTSMSFYEYDTMDTDRTAQGLYGFVVRANEFHARTDGTDNTGIGGRYEAGTYNISGLAGLDMLSVRTIFQGNEGANSGYEYARYGPGRSLSSISRDATGDVMVFHGVLPGEDPALTTMWLLIGQSNYGIAVPTWARVSDIPHCLSSGDMYTLVRSLYDKGDEATIQACTYPVESHHFDEIIGELLPHWRVHGVPSIADMTRIENRMADDAYSLLECLDVRQSDNRAPSVVLSDVSEGRTANFTAEANDSDGSVVSIAWNFGDNRISSEPSAWHTYAAAGTYLVSCTVTDDDGVSITDWKYCVIEELIGDFEPDGDVDLVDFCMLAYWYEDNCPGTSTCGGTNMTDDETVNVEDLRIFFQNWNPDPEVFSNPTPPVEIPVSSSSDDAEQLNIASASYSAGHMYLDSSDLELIDNATYHGPDQTVGIRFNNVNIDQGGQVDHAYIQFTVSADAPDLNPCELTIRAQDADNASTFTTAAFDITNRPVTSANVAWQPVVWTAGWSGPEQQTPDVAGLIQEVVNRSGWSNGNSIVFIIAGTGRRTAASWDGSAGGAPRLVMNSAPVEQPSVANMEASNITETSAFLNGRVLHTGIENPMVSIFWGTSDGGVESDNWEHREDIGVKDAETFYVSVTGLSADVTYYFRCYAENSAGGTWANSTASFVAKKPAYKVNSASDDAEELNSDGEMYLTSSDLELINDDSYRGGDQTVGLRFNNIDIDPGTSIGSAYIQFTVKETGSDSCSLTIRGEATDNAAPFTMTDYNITSRTPTAASETWVVDAWDTVGQAAAAQRSPDISGIIAEIVSGGGWSNGNSLVIIITGSGRRTAKSYDNDANAAPSLHIELE